MLRAGFAVEEILFGCDGWSPYKGPQGHPVFYLLIPIILPYITHQPCHKLS
jgi:hypothetical protein